MSDYVAACIEDFDRSDPLSWGPFATVFLGGGTPSQLPARELVRLLDGLGVRPGRRVGPGSRAFHEVQAVHEVHQVEVTIEANPEDVTETWLAACEEAGVSRVSLGVQSLDPVVLEGLGRRHDPAAVGAAASRIGASGIGSYSVDLIYGGAGETDTSWQATLGGVLELDPPPAHVSAYALTVEPGTVLWRDSGRHPDEDIQARRYEVADAVLSEAGLQWYEISNWARPGHECRHNANYWARGDYLGIGCAAHSHRRGRRWWNLRTPQRYIAAVRAGQSSVAASEDLDDDTVAMEALELSLRTTDGVPANALRLDDPALAGLVDQRGERAVLSLRGRMLANEVACRLRIPAVRPAV